MPAVRCQPTRARLGVALLVAVVGSAARVDAAPMPAEPRLQTVDYRPDAVLSLTGFVGYHVHLEFAPGEHFVTLAAGDTASLDVGAEGNHLLLKPKRATPGTNLTLLTNRRTYFVDYRAYARAPRPGEAVYSIRFQYPPDAGIAGPAAVVPALKSALDPLPAATNSDYWFCGSAALRPVAADDDGVQIRLKFPATAELPAVYAAGPDRAEMLVNSHVENDTIVVHRIAQRLVLRRGQLVGCVVNHALPSAQRRAATGTLRDAVERSTREVDR